MKLSPLFVLLLGTLVLASCTNTNESTIQSSVPANTTSVSAATSSPTTNTKTISYRTDHGKHTVSVTFDVSTEADGTINALYATMNRGDHESAEYITRFNNAARSKIIGKKIGSLSLASVGGASDTTEAFMIAATSL